MDKLKRFPQRSNSNDVRDRRVTEKENVDVSSDSEED